MLMTAAKRPASVTVRFLRDMRDVVEEPIPGWAYTGPLHLLLSVGRFFTPPSAAEPWGDPGKAFDNALQAALVAPALFYCEGYALSPAGIPVPHAWVCDAAGSVTELTWNTPGTEYFGVALQTRYVLSLRVGDGSALDNWKDLWPLVQGRDHIFDVSHRYFLESK